MAVEASWQTVLQNACKLWLRLDRGRGDPSAGPDLIYALDTNVLLFFENPGKHHRFASLLGLLDGNKEDQRKILERRAYILSEEILHRCQDRTCVWLPGHDEEFLSVYSTLKRKATARVSETIDRGDGWWKEKLEALSGARGDAAIEMFQKSDELISALLGEVAGEVEELRRLNFFIDKTDLQPAEKVLSEAGVPNVEEERIQDHADAWFGALRKHKSTRRASHLLAWDASALAYLAWINQVFRRQSNRKRIVLLTFDDTIQSLTVSGGDFSGHEDQIRDPRQFVSTLRFSEAEDSPRFDVSRWLRVFLSPLSKGGDIDQRQVAKIAYLGDEKKLSRYGVFFQARHGERLEEMKEEWEKFARDSVLVHSMTSNPMFEGTASKIRHALRTNNFDTLRTAIFRHASRTLMDLSSTSAVAGLYIRVREREQPENHGRNLKTLSRLPFVLRFPTGVTPTAKEIYGQINEAVRASNIDKIKLVEEGVVHSYAAHLIYGMFFAAARDWGATLNLAESAKIIARARAYEDEEVTGGEGELLGEEAEFMRAVALRHTAKKPDDIHEARRALDNFHDLWMEVHDESDIRYESESIALDLFELHARKYGQDVWSETRGLPDIEDVIENLISLYDRIEHSDEEPIIKVPLQKQVLTNVLISALLEWLNGEDEQANSNNEILIATRTALKELRSIMNTINNSSGEISLYKSRFVENIMQVLEWVYGDVSYREEFSNRVLAACKELESERGIFYDEKRFREVYYKVMSFGK